MAEEGRDFMVADYSAIEARVVLWLAAAESALDVFRRGEDIYCDMATGIYGFQVQKAIAKDWRPPSVYVTRGLSSVWQTGYSRPRVQHGVSDLLAHLP